MAREQCPYCAEELEVQEVTPCTDCGAHPEELGHLKAGKHTYARYRLGNGPELILCDFCYVDSTSWYPEDYGLPKGTKLGPGEWHHVADVPAEVVKDKVCPKCYRRRSLFRFINA